MRKLTWWMAAAAAAQTPVTFESRPAVSLSNDRIELVVMNQGGAFTSLVLKDDGEKMNPMWNPVRAARETGGPVRFGASMGHFVCVDGFGPTSAEERAAGFEGHGEAHRQPWEMVSSGKNAGVLAVRWRARLPIVQEVFERTVEMADGEQVVYVGGALESLVGFDRPANWAEHATIGSPFLAAEQTVVDASVGRCMVRPHDGRPPHVLVSGKEFEFPAAPRIDGGIANLRFAPAGQSSMDHTGCAMAAGREHAWVTALRLDQRLLFGYLWKRAEYPWLQQWMNWVKPNDMAWGLEFGTQPFDVPRRQTVDMGKLFDLPGFRWLPAKSKIASRFVMFYTRSPEGMTRVEDVRFGGGSVVIEGGGKKVELKASLAL